MTYTHSSVHNYIAEYHTKVLALTVLIVDLAICNARSGLVERTSQPKTIAIPHLTV